MSKFDECMETYRAECKKCGISLDDGLLTSVAKGLGPSIYLADASKVSSTDPEELARVKANYCEKKLGSSDDAANGAAIQAAIDALGSSNRNKYRAVFYAIVCKELGKESVYA